MQYKEKDGQWFVQTNDANGYLTWEEIDFNPLPEEKVEKVKIDFKHPAIQISVLILAGMMTSLSTMIWYRPAPEIQIDLTINELNLWKNQKDLNLEKGVEQKDTILKDNASKNIKKLDTKTQGVLDRVQDILIPKE